MVYYVILRKETSIYSGNYSMLEGFTESPITVKLYIDTNPDIDVDVQEVEIPGFDIPLDDAAIMLSKEIDIDITEYDYLYPELSDDGKECVIWSNNKETEFEEMYIVSDYIHEYLTTALAIQSMSLLFTKEIRDELAMRMQQLMMGYIVPLISLDLSCGDNVIIKQLDISDNPEAEYIYTVIDRVKMIRRILGYN